MSSESKPFIETLRAIEEKWQTYWDRNQSFRAAQPGEPGSDKPKYYCLDMFPYPSGDGLHIGHPEGYTATDIVSRYKRMRGFNVLHPMGWDAFGLPAEQYAIQKGVHPATTTQKNIATFKRQLKSLGFSYDWSREISTIDPSYYKWTQWLFKRLYEKGLAYQAEVAVNWCPALGTVLANDEVIDGKSERGGHPVERRPMRQWVLKITSYADRLLEDLATLDWPESTKDHQRHWIGRSEGAHVVFRLEPPEKSKPEMSPSEKGDSKDSLEVFTTRPDTLFGVTFMAVAPEHPWVKLHASSAQKQLVVSYAEAAARKSDLQRQDNGKEKSGVFLGVHVVHPLTQNKIPVYVADYVLMGYGTGAVMGVPAHDERDELFANKLSLPIIKVIDESQRLINSPGFDGSSCADGAKAVIAALEQKSCGRKAVTYRLRDWLFARQRYWGEPIPVLHIVDGPDKGKIRLLADDELPLELPAVERYEPTGTGESPLSAVSNWVNTKDPVTGAAARRETNTMPGSAGSSWYFLRYMDPRNEQAAWGSQAESYWRQVDLYIGGQEHAVGHLLYARFWQKVFFDLGLVSESEPFKKLVHQGMILGEDGEKMSKSRGNVINPDSVVEKYGADALRLYEMFLGPLEKDKPWNTHSIEGVFRFLARAWRLVVQDDLTSRKLPEEPETQWAGELRRHMHAAIKAVTEAIESLRFNVAISQMMVMVNEAYAFEQAHGPVPKSYMERLTLLMAPFAPHLAEEMWHRLGHPASLSHHPWPKFDASLTEADEMEIAIQINGKLRDTIKVNPEIAEADLQSRVLDLQSVKKWIDGKPVKKFIYVKKKLVSVVV